MYQLTIDRAEEIALDILREYSADSKTEITWKSMNEQQLWEELVSCILGSRVTYEHAKSALSHLINNNYLNVHKIVSSPDAMESKIVAELSSPFFLPFKKDGTLRKYRYPKIKAEQICQSAILLYSMGGTITKMLISDKSKEKIRELLIQNTKGIGPKQASLFLRNIGYSNDFAIIDSHLLNFMRKKQLIDKNINAIKTPSEYYNLEEVFIHYANHKNVSPGELDLAIWAVSSISTIEGYQ